MNIIQFINRALTPAAVLLTTTLVRAPAADFGSSTSFDTTAAGGTMVSAVGAATNNYVNLIMGPGMYAGMAIGVIVALIGLGTGNKESLFTGIGLFVFAAILRGIWFFL
jgi:hypothetical protein